MSRNFSEEKGRIPKWKSHSLATPKRCNLLKYLTGLATEFQNYCTWKEWSDILFIPSDSESLLFFEDNAISFKQYSSSISERFGSILYLHLVGSVELTKRFKFELRLWIHVSKVEMNRWSFEAMKFKWGLTRTLSSIFLSDLIWKYFGLSAWSAEARLRYKYLRDYCNKQLLLVKVSSFWSSYYNFGSYI